MALVERIMQWGRVESDTAPPAFEPEDRWVATHAFFAAQLEVLQGNLTVAQVKTFLNMTAADEVDYDAMIALVTALPTLEEKHVKTQQFHSIFLLAELRLSGQYDTPADVRTKIGI